MPQRIIAPDGTPIDFPDEMNDDQITGAMQKLHLQHPEWGGNPPAAPAPWQGGHTVATGSGQPVGTVQSKPPVGPNLDVQPDTSSTAQFAAAHPHVSSLLADPSTPGAADESGGGAARAVNDYQAIGRGMQSGADTLGELTEQLPKVPDTISKAITSPGPNAPKNALDLYEKGMGTIAHQLNPANMIAPKRRPNEPWDERLAETSGNLAFNTILGKLASHVFPESPTEPSGVSDAQVRDMRRALRPQDRNLKFASNVRQAFPSIIEQINKLRGQVPETLPEWQDLIENAKKGLWDKYTTMLNRASVFGNKAKAALPAASTDIETGVQDVRGGKPGGTYPAASRPIVQAGPEASRSAAAAQVGSQAATIPESVFGPKTVEGTQYLTGVEGGQPNLSGELTNPGSFSTRNVEQIRATRDRLSAIANDPAHFNSFSPGEQSAILGQLDRMNKVLQPSPKIPYGPTIDGNIVADAIERTLDKRTGLKNPSAVQNIYNFAQTYRRPIPLPEAEEFLQGANKDSSPWYEAAKKDPHAQPHLRATVAEGNALRQELYKQLDKIADPGTAAQLKKTYGSLEALHQAVVKRIPVWERQAPNLMGRQIHLPLAIARAVYHISHPLSSILSSASEIGTEELMRHENSPEHLMRRAVTANSPPSIPRQVARAAGQGALTSAAMNNAVASPPGATHVVRNANGNVIGHVVNGKFVRTGETK